ncbi:uncharacterized protein TRIADDRAFT_54855 [Trichoplax adhaerens]|uniref:Uncharacterized protein n=1 Tax=Trichoplax adhaerens TaxID=10228 RepID=B3RT66_TRIAD|nr:hypothetical protein TRIADDRAFT_54855 [Trichoplax adhaerens]EDV26643.1 hypothetical protein TRIADDRAFT_54855 [Trichoplax adhaerens]|eukprot:XP_002110639.1 hypothetical protein TRIADDRAFT_54855 [Trichoplax adhaerens]
MVLYIAIALIAVAAYIFLFTKRGRINGIREKYVLVTGCDSGFGLLLTEQLDRLGVKVFAACLLQKSVDEIGQKYSHAIPFTMNVTDSEDIRKGVAFVKQKLPENEGLWGVVNNAGVVGCGYAEWLTRKDFMKVLDVNLLGVIDVTVQFLHLIQKAKGRVVNIGSLLGRHHETFAAPYVVSKFGVLGFSDSLRMEMRPFGVSVHNICPGYFQTGLVRSASDIMRHFEATLDKELISRYGKEHMKEYSYWIA